MTSVNSYLVEHHQNKNLRKRTKTFWHLKNRTRLFANGNDLYLYIYIYIYISDWIYKKLPPNAGTITIA